MSERIGHLTQPAADRRIRPPRAEARPGNRFGFAPIAVYVAVVALWLAFAVLLLQGAGEVDDLWQRYRALPLGVEATIGVLLLPWVLAVSIWQSAWPLAPRIVLDILLAVVTLVAFFPVGQTGDAGRRPLRAGDEAADPGADHGTRTPT